MAGHKSVSASVWHDLLSKFGISKDVSETQKLAKIHHLAITEDLKRLFKDTQWTVEKLSFVTGHKSVSASVS